MWASVGARVSDDHAGAVAEELQELRNREKEAGYTPDWELDAFMKAEIRKGKKESIVTDLVIKLLGLDVRPLCSCQTPFHSAPFSFSCAC